MSHFVIIRAPFAVRKIFCAGDCSTNCLADSFARGATPLARRVAHALSAASLLMISQMNARRHFVVYFWLHTGAFCRKARQVGKLRGKTKAARRRRIQSLLTSSFITGWISQAV